jgi:hypothetical protein
MAAIDDTFSPIPSPLIDKWGIPITYIKAGTDSYNTTTGVVTVTDTNVTLKAIITAVNKQENQGLYQVGDLKIYIAAASLPAYQPSIQDRIEYSENNVNRQARIIDIKTYRGKSPIFFSVVARPE